jgi:hypothetical protein
MLLGAGRLGDGAAEMLPDGAVGERGLANPGRRVLGGALAKMALENQACVLQRLQALPDRVEQDLEMSAAAWERLHQPDCYLQGADAPTAGCRHATWAKGTHDLGGEIWDRQREQAVRLDPGYGVLVGLLLLVPEHGR